MLLTFGFIMSTGACYHNKFCFRFFDNLLIRTIALSLLPFLPLFLLSLITYKMKDEVFTAWISFAKWWVPLSMFAILITPVDDGGSWSIPLKGPVALLTTGLFFVISLIIICWKHFALRKKTDHEHYLRTGHHRQTVSLQLEDEGCASRVLVSDLREVR